MDEIGVNSLHITENASRSFVHRRLQPYSRSLTMVSAGFGGNGSGELAPATRSQPAVLGQMGVGVSSKPSASDRPNVATSALAGYNLARGSAINSCVTSV